MIDAGGFVEFAEFDGNFDDAQAEFAGDAVPGGLRLFDCARASEQDLERVESELNIQLPWKYREFMKKYGGGQFLFVDLLPVITQDPGEEDLLGVNSNASWRDYFVAVAPVGTGDWWGFSLAAGICGDQVDFLYHDDENIEGYSPDFLEFLSKQGLQPR
jgi:antitoxin YobK